MLAVLTVVPTATPSYSYSTPQRRERKVLASPHLQSLPISRYRAYICILSGRGITNAPAVGILPLQSGSGARVIIDR